MKSFLLWYHARAARRAYLQYQSALDDKCFGNEMLSISARWAKRRCNHHMAAMTRLDPVNYKAKWLI